MQLPRLRNLASTRYLVHRNLQRFMRHELANRRFGVVVDIGAGRAPYRKFIDCERYVPVDVENRSGNPDTLIADINDRIPLADASADCVICTEVLEHLKQPQAALKEIARILTPGGLLILTTPMTWPLHEAPQDFFRYTAYGLRHLLEQAGFPHATIRPSNNYAVTVVQVAIAPLRSRLWAPVVVAANAIALATQPFAWNYELPIDNYVTAVKPE